MPTTDLPDPNAYRGTAGFKWQPGGSTDRPEQVHALQWPPHLVPGGGYETRRKKYRATAESFDGSNLERFTVGSGNERARMPLRFDSWAESLGDLLEDAADGVVVDFYPRLESTNLKFPVELVDVGDVTRVRDDSDRHGFGEFEVESVWKDASTDDQGFWWMEGPNKLKNPRLARGTTDGVAEEWSSFINSTNVTGDFSIQGRSQRIRYTSVDSSTGKFSLQLFQDTDGFVAGDTLELSAELKALGVSTAGDVQFVVDERSSTGLINRNVSSDFRAVTEFDRKSMSATFTSSNATFARSILRVRAGSSDDDLGRAFFRDAKLTLQ